MSNHVDEWGFDQEFLGKLMPYLTFLYAKYWRVETTGLENIPASGRALLVANHSGQFPFDGFMLGIALLTEHPAKRLVRALYGTWFATLPFASALMTRLGGVLASEENGIRLLEQDQLVAVFPEGYKGISKLYTQRYRLARFGRGGFIHMALKTRTPIIPVSIVGAEETYISLAKIPGSERFVGYPLPPITPSWPWLGLLGAIPLPTKWFIDIGAPLPTGNQSSEAANQLTLVLQLSDQIRNTIQQMTYQRLGQRKSVFFG